MSRAFSEMKTVLNYQTGKKPRIVGIIQCRMGSSRLPGKTMVDIAGKPLLAHVIERVKLSETIEKIVIATTTRSEDKIILMMGEKYKVMTYAGSETDVLDRFYQAAMQARAQVIVRVTADDPFKDPIVIDKVVNEFLGKKKIDYASNTIQPTYPEGLDVEVFSFEALKKAWKEAKLPSEREHVTPYIWKNPGLFQLANISHHENLSHLRWTLDYEEDLRFVRKVYSQFHSGKIFLMGDILNLLQARPEITKINQGIEQYSGYKRAVEQDPRQ